MLESVKLQRRQSEIRQSLAELAGKESPEENEIRTMQDLDTEYRTNETRYRAALIAEDTERREAGQALETRADREWSDLVEGFELRQVALHFDEGRGLSGRTAEVVEEMRNAGGYRGVPVPWAALETRNTVAAGTPDPVSTRPIIDRLFPQSVAGAMGGNMINVDQGHVEYPVTSSSVTAGWADGEAANVAGPTQYTTVDRPLVPNFNLGITMSVSRRALKQTGNALEQAIRRDMQGTIASELDKAVFLGTGADGQPLGLIPGQATYGFTATAVDAAADYAVMRAAITRFMVRNAAGSPAAIRALIRPELWDFLDGELITGTAVSEWDRLTRAVPAGNFAMSSNALDEPDGPSAGALETSALLTTTIGGQAPFYVATWGGVDLIRDPFTDARSGGLRLTALVTADVTISRAAQIELLTGLEI